MKEAKSIGAGFGGVLLGALLGAQIAASGVLYEEVVELSNPPLGLEKLAEPFVAAGAWDGEVKGLEACEFVVTESDLRVVCRGKKVGEKVPENREGHSFKLLDIVE